MKISRRQWLGFAAGAYIAPAAAAGKIRLRGVRFGVTDFNLGLGEKVEAFDLAKKIGFEGVEVNIGRTPTEDGKLRLENTELQAQYLDAVRRTKVQIASLILDILHVNNLKTDPLARKWLAAAIPIAEKMKAPSILLPVFGKAAPIGPRELDRMGDMLWEFAHEAEKAKVVLAIEDTISAEDNIRLVDRTRSPSMKVFYDVGNRARFDPVREIRALGRERIAQFHFKDRGYLGGERGRVNFPAVLQAIADIGYRGWIDFETSNPSKSVEDDMKRNLAYIRSLIA